MSTAPAPAERRALVAPLANTIEALVAAVNTGSNDINAPVRSAMKDFLNVLSGVGDAAVVGDAATTLTFGYNVPATRRQLRVETRFGKPKLSASATGAIGDPTLAAGRESSLSALDDLGLTVIYTPTTRMFGRAIEPHLPLFAATFVAPPFASDADAQNALLQALTTAAIAAADVDRPLGQNTTAVAFETAVRAALTVPQSDLANDFAALLSNQPQLYWSFTFHERDDLVGPREWRTSLTWEIGSRNLNGFYRAEGRQCAQCADALTAYITRAGNLRNAHRVALSIDYARTRETEVVPGTPFAPFSYVETHNLSYTAIYGRPFASFFTGQEGRIDVTVKYSGNVTTTTVSTPGAARAFGGNRDDVFVTLRPSHDRFVAGATYTQKISDRLSIPVSVVYRERIDHIPARPLVISPPVVPETIVRTEPEMCVLVGVSYRATPAASRPSCCCCP